MTRRDDSEARLQSVQRVREALRSTRMALGLVVLLGLSSLFAAAATCRPEQMYAGIAAWLFGQVVVLAVAVAGLRGLRRRRFGARPSPRIRRTSDALLHVAATAGGLLALAVFVPNVIEGRADAGTIAAACLGTALLVSGLRTAWLYALRE